MIQYPKLNAGTKSRQKLELFKGLNRSLRIGSGEFSEMENLTSDDYPVLSTRRKRGCHLYSLQDGGIATGMLYVPGTGLFITVNQRAQNQHDECGALFLLTPEGELQYITSQLFLGPKSLALVGNKVVIAPDMKWVSIKPFDSSSHNLFHVQDVAYSKQITSGEIQIALCKADGTVYPLPLPFETIYEDTEIENGAITIDESVYPPVLKQYSKIQKEWFLVNSTYVKISGESLNNHSFYKGDGITITGVGYGDGHIVDHAASLLNGDTVVIDCDDKGIIIEGMLSYTFYTQQCETCPVTVERKVPKMDFIVECGNRLWGCSKTTNEIYACKLGDFKNWNCFQGLSTDSWVGSVGTPGEFTGAVVQNGYPVFYKENCKHKIWTSATGAHQMTTVNCNGVEKGSESSLAVWDGTVFYKSAFGVFADDGSGTVEIGKDLGTDRYRNAVGAIYDRKYYLSMEDSTGKRALFVYDIARRMWHRENSVDGVICSAQNSLYGADETIWDLTGNTGTPEETVPWFAVTGDLGLELPEQKYISRLTLRLQLEPGATLEVFAQYDREQEWVKLGQVYGTDLRSFSLPVRPRRCDQLRLKLQGTGMCKLYSITKTLERGSEQP